MPASSTHVLALTPKELAPVLANRLLAGDLGSAALFVSGVPRNDLPHEMWEELSLRGRHVLSLDLEALGDPPDIRASIDVFYEMHDARPGEPRSEIWPGLRRRFWKPLALVVECAEHLEGFPEGEVLLGTLKSVSEQMVTRRGRDLVIAFLGRDHERMCRLVDDRRQPFFASTLVKAPPITPWPS